MRGCGAATSFHAVIEHGNLTLAGMRPLRGNGAPRLPHS